MKKFIFSTIFILILPILTFSQTSSWRTSPPSNNSSSSSSKTTNTTNQVSTWRNSSPSEFNKPRTNQVVSVHEPWFDMGWNRWSRWGVPTFGWNSFMPSWYYNDWGYRQPSRIYFLDNGKRDTVKGKKPIISFGIQHTTNKQMGLFFTIGNKGYFVFDFNTTYERDRSTYFPYGTINLVDFPLISDLVKQNSFYIGAGKRLGRLGIHVMVGHASERILWRGKDDVGEITFPKSQDNFLTFKGGLMKDFKNLTLKMDFDPVIKYGQIGVGLNF